MRREEILTNSLQLAKKWHDIEKSSGVIVLVIGLTHISDITSDMLLAVSLSGFGARLNGHSHAADVHYGRRALPMAVGI